MTWGFDPPDTGADVALIRARAEGFGRLSGQLTGRQDSLTFVLGSLASAFSEVLHPMIRARIGEQFYTLQEVVGAMLYAEHVTEAWAYDVAAFQQHRADLVQRWESACSNGFWITRAAGYDNVEPEMRGTLYDDARLLVLAQLNAEADLAYADFSAAADQRGQQFREGPTVANLLQVRSGGPLGGPGSGLLYPYLPVPGPRSGLPRRYWGRTAAELLLASEDDPELAALLVARQPSLTSADPFEAALARAVRAGHGANRSGSGHGTDSAEQVADAARILGEIPAEELTLLAAMFPAAVGNLNGMPFEYRIAANRIRVADALAQARTLELDDRIEQYELLLTEPTPGFGGLQGPPWSDYRGHKLLYFDPAGDVAWAELVGTVGPGTDAVGVLVSGMGTDGGDLLTKSSRATEFVAAAAREGDQLAMIVWTGGDLPDGIPNALSAGYAADLLEPLVDFSNAVGQEIEDQAGGRPIPVTIVGHSYGGLTMATATLLGLSADRLVLVNAPGLDPWPVGNLVAEELESYDTYALSVPWDPAASAGPLVYGMAPSAVPAVTQLETGTYRDGTRIVGVGGHSGVFEEGSTAWENILAVMLGRPVLGD